MSLVSIFFLNLSGKYFYQTGNSHSGFPGSANSPSKSHPMQRRNFLKISGLTTLSTGLVHAFLYGSTAENPLDEKSLNLQCEPTTADILGPYYRTNAPLRSDIVPADDPDPNTIRISGKVTDADCRPLEGASVDLWQAGGDGEYDNATPEFRYRGAFVTDADGNYFFRTVKPGFYLNGSQFRPAHLHFRVTRPGYKSIITQLYFEGDEYIPEDEWASDPSAARRILPLVEVNAGDHKYELAFDFSLDIRTGAGSLPSDLAGQIRYTNPFLDELSIQAESDSLVIYAAELLDLQGRLLLSQYRLQAQQHVFRTEALGAGLYFLRVKTSKGIGVFRVVKAR
jgi:protocatechuate 3,4-dioxygenase beta subunit